MYVLSKIVETIGKPFLMKYLRKTRPFRYKQLQLLILPGVFHPRFFFSSKFLATFVESLDVTNKRFCEPCCGSGLISLVARKKGAHVLCFDINPLAVENCKVNAKRNNINSEFHVLESNGFSAIPVQHFDTIVVNPPYFFQKVTNSTQLAWNCGKEGEFFSKFFDEYKQYLHTHGKCYMVLAENCDIKRIKLIANKHGSDLFLTKTKRIWWEKNFIFEIVRL
jgi:release factor glutamine methyltransferase